MTAAAPVAQADPWFGRTAGPYRPRDPSCLLFCLAEAGAGAASFRGWSQLLEPAVEVLPVRLPGRDRRIGEPARLEPARIAAAIAAGLAARRGGSDGWGPPYALYGHSLGARLAFDVARELRRLGAPAPLRLYAGAARPPDVPEPLAEAVDLPADAFLAELEHRIDAPVAAFEHEEFRDLILPVLTSDFAWLRGYAYRPEAPLETAIVALVGTGDREVTAADVVGWAAHTTGVFELRIVPGNHFFHHAPASAVPALLAEDLAQALAAATPAATAEPAPHLVPLPGTEWSVWRQAVLRTTGFPVDGLDRLGAPAALAAAADASLGQPGRPQATAEFDEQFAQACAGAAAEVWKLAGESRFREAVTWQNRSALVALDALRRGGPDPGRRTRKQRERERLVARYWQRYCAKSETIGFFGPVCWIRLESEETGPGLSAVAGPALTAERTVRLEDWALTVLARRLAADEAIRPWLPARLPAQLALDGDRLLDPSRAAVKLSRAELALIEACDGVRGAKEAAALAAASPGCGLRSEDDALLVLDRLVERGLMDREIDLPVEVEAEAALRCALSALPDPDARHRSLEALDRLAARREAVAAAAGEPEALCAALDALDQEFVDLCGHEPARRAGEMYAGRGLCWEETTRDLDVTVGEPVLRALAGPLDVLLRAARWFCAELAAEYRAALRGLYDDVAADLGGPTVPLNQLWFLAQGLFYGTGPRPVDAVTERFASRWAQLFGADRTEDEGTADRGFSCARLEPEVRRLFPSRAPGWTDARLHSPDIQLGARDAAAMRRGEFTAVLGEMHAAWATNTCGVFVSAHPDPDTLRTAHAADVGSGRLRPLLPVGWPRHTARLAFALDDPADAHLAFAPAPGAATLRATAAGAVLPIGALSVVPDARGELTARAPDGLTWPLAEVFARQLSELAVDAFKLTGTGAYSPRVTLDRMVVARRTWRTTVGACPLSRAVGDRERFLAGRAWRRALGLPDRFFAKIGSETKPVFADLSAPLYVDALASMLRSARMMHGDEVVLTVSEMLPDSDQAWVPDAEGRRYVSELRLQIRDPLRVQAGQSAPERRNGSGR